MFKSFAKMKWTPELIAEARNLYLTGHGQRKIGKLLNTPWQSVWPHIKGIKKSDRTKLPTSGVTLPIPPNANQMTCAKARIIAYLMADGCVLSTTKKTIRVTREGKKTFSYPAAFIGLYNMDAAVIEQFIRFWV